MQNQHPSIKRIVLNVCFALCILLSALNVQVSHAKSTTERFVKGPDLSHLIEILRPSQSQWHAFDDLDCGRIVGEKKAHVVYCLDNGFPSGRDGKRAFKRSDWQTVLRNNPKLAWGIYTISKLGFPQNTYGLSAKVAEATTQIAIWQFMMAEGFQNKGMPEQEDSNIRDFHLSKLRTLDGDEKVNAFAQYLLKAAQNPIAHGIQCKTLNLNCIPKQRQLNRPEWALDASGQYRCHIQLSGHFDQWEALNNSQNIDIQPKSGKKPGIVELRWLGKEPPQPVQIQFKATQIDSPDVLDWFEKTADDQNWFQSQVVFHRLPLTQSVLATISPEYPNGEIEIIKTDETSKPLSHIAFELLKHDKEKIAFQQQPSGFYQPKETGESTQLRTDQNGRIQIKDLQPGTYQLVEIPTAPYIPKEPQTVEINKGKKIICQISNQRQFFSAKLKKTDAKTQSGLANAIFGLRLIQLTHPDAYPEFQKNLGTLIHSHLTSDEKGEILVENLPPGTYAWEEQVPPTGYEKNQESKVFALDENQIDEAGFCLTSMSNTPNRIIVRKLDAQTKQPIHGAIFALWQAQNKPTRIKAFKIDQKEGHLLTQLPPGDYWLEEEKPPKGYAKNTTRYPFRIHPNGKPSVDQIDILNFKLPPPTQTPPAPTKPKRPSLPRTGEKNPWISLIMLLGLSLSASWFLWSHHKHQN